MEESGGSPAAEGLAPESGKRCRDMVGVTIRAFVNLLQDAAIDDKVTMDGVRRIAQAILSAGGPLAVYYARTESMCAATFELAAIGNRRTDYLGRLITEPFAHLLDDPDSGIDRKHLAQFFAAIRMIVGDEAHADLQARATVIAESHRGDQGMIDWDSFHDDPEIRAILEQVQVTVARSFRRFDGRKDWFLLLMNQTMASVSLASNAFVPRKPDDKPPPEFKEEQMARLFDALFQRTRPDGYTTARRDAFVKRWDAPPEKVFGPLHVEILKLKQRAGLA
ncbi:MAG: hypothetical protein ACM33T_02560 [Solirubrobacterales bacterium]